MDPVTEVCKKITNHERRGKEFCKHSSFACKELQEKYLKLEEEEEIWLAEKRRYILKLTDYSLDKKALKREKNLLQTELDKFLKEKNEMLQIINDISHDRKVLEVKLEEISRENEVLQTKLDKVLKEKNEMIKTTKDKSHILESSDYSVDKSCLEVKVEEMERKIAILQTQLDEKVQIIKGKSQVIRQFLDRQNKVAKCNYMHNLGKLLWSFNSAKDKIDVYCAKQQTVLQKLEKVEQTCNNCRSTAQKDRQNYEQRIEVLENDLLNLRFLNDQLNHQSNEMKHDCEKLKQELRKYKKGNKENRKSSSKESGEILLPPTPDTPFSDENSIRGDFEEDSQHTTSTVESYLEPVINALDNKHISRDIKMISKSRKTPLKKEPDNLDGKSEKRAIGSHCTQDTVKDLINKSVSGKRIGRKRSSQRAIYNIPGFDLDNSTVELTNKSVHGKDQKVLEVKVIKDAKSSEVINSPESISEKSLNSGFFLDGVTVHNMPRSLSDENEKVFKTDSLNTNKDCIKDLSVLEDEDSSPAKESPNLSVNFIKQLLPVVEDKVALSDNSIECTSKSSGHPVDWAFTKPSHPVDQAGLSSGNYLGDIDEDNVSLSDNIIECTSKSSDHPVNRAFTKPSQPIDRADLSSGNYLGDIDAKRVMRSDGWSPPYNPETDNFEQTLHMLTVTPKVLSPLKEVSHSRKVKQRPSIFSPVPSDSSNQSETKVFSEETGKEPVGTSIGDVFIQEDAHVTCDKNCDRKNSYSQSSNIPRKIYFEDTITGSQGISENVENEGNVKTAHAVKTRKLKTKKDHKSLKKIVINEEGQINHTKANCNESSKVFEENLTISAEDNLELSVNDNSLPLDLSLKNVKSILGVEKISCSKENNSKINGKRKKDSSKVEASLLETTCDFNFEKSFNTCYPLKRTWDESELEPIEPLNCVPLKNRPKTSPLAHYSPDTTTNITTKTVDSEVKIKKVSREIKALNSSYSPDSLFTSPRSEHVADFSQVSFRSPTAMDRYELRQSLKLPKSIQYSACKKRPNSNKAKKNSFSSPVKEVVKKPKFVKNGSVESASNRKTRLDSKSCETRTILAKNRNCDTATSRSVSPSPESMRNYSIRSDDSKGKCGYCDSVTCVGLEEKGCKRKLTEDPQSTVDPKHFLLKRLKVLPDIEEEIHRAKQNTTLEIDQRLLPQERLEKSFKTCKDFIVPLEMNVDCEHTRCISVIKNKSSSEQSIEKIKTPLTLTLNSTIGNGCENSGGGYTAENISLNTSPVTLQRTYFRTSKHNSENDLGLLQIVDKTSSELPTIVAKRIVSLSNQYCVRYQQSKQEIQLKFQYLTKRSTDDIDVRPVCKMETTIMKEKLFCKADMASKSIGYRSPLILKPLGQSSEERKQEEGRLTKNLLKLHSSFKRSRLNVKKISSIKIDDSKIDDSQSELGNSLSSSSESLDKEVNGSSPLLGISSSPRDDAKIGSKQVLDKSCSFRSNGLQNADKETYSTSRLNLKQGIDKLCSSKKNCSEYNDCVLYSTSRHSSEQLVGELCSFSNNDMKCNVTESGISHKHSSIQQVIESYAESEDNSNILAKPCPPSNNILEYSVKESNITRMDNTIVLTKPCSSSNDILEYPVRESYITSKLSPKLSVDESCLPGRLKQLVETQELCLSNNESSKHVISDSYLSRKNSSKLESNKASQDCSKIVDFKSYSSNNDGSNQVIVFQQDSIIKTVKSTNKMETIAIESNSSNSSLSLNGDDDKLDEDCLVIDVDEEDWLNVSDTDKNSPWVEDQTMSCEADFTTKLTNEGANTLSKTMELYQNTSVTQPVDTKSNTSRNMESYGARTQLSYNPIIPSFTVPSYQPLPEAMCQYEEKLVKTNTDFSYPENRVPHSSLNSSESQNIPSPINKCVINFYSVQADSSKSNNPEAVSEDKCSFPKLSNNSAFKLMSLHQLIPRGDKTLVTENVLRTVIKKHKENLEGYRKKNILIGRSTDNDTQGKATTKELTTKVLEIFMPLVRKDVTCLSDINRAVDRVEEYEIRVIVRAVMVFLKDAASQALMGHHYAQWMLDCDMPELPNKKSPIVHPKIQISYMFLYLAIERFTKDRSCEEKKKFVDEELHFIEAAFHGVVNEFTEPNPVFWLNLAFLYTLLARNFGFVARVRQLMYDMFYCFTRRANVVAYAMLKVWSFVLPIKPIEFFSNDPLSLSIILQLTAVPPDVNTRGRIIASKLQDLMSRKYRFRFNTVDPDQLLNMCLERLGQSGVHEALVLLAKRQPRDWFLKRPVHQLMEVVEGWSEQKEDCGDVRAVAAIKAVCATLRPYQPTSIQQEITKLFNIFVKILSDESTPMWMQEVIVLNFCLLSRVNQLKSLELITKWRPTEISEEVVDQILVDVVVKRPPIWWSKNKIAHQFLSQ